MSALFIALCTLLALMLILLISTGLLIGFIALTACFTGKPIKHTVQNALRYI